MPLDQQGYTITTIEIEEPPQPTLPDLLSNLILVALADVDKAEDSPLYRINMSIWHDPLQYPDTVATCVICFAGGVMAFSLGADPTRAMRPANYGHATRCKLYALNSIRVGMVAEAYHQLFLHRQLSVPARDFRWEDERIISYETNPALFKTQMRDLAGRLAAAGY